MNAGAFGTVIPSLIFTNVIHVSRYIDYRLTLVKGTFHYTQLF